MFCKNCGDKLGPADRFCGSCGTPKVDLCPTCGQVWEKEKAEEKSSPATKSAPKEKSNSGQPVRPVSASPVVDVHEPASVVPKIEIAPTAISQISSARIQPVYGKLYELGKDCPNCGEKGQKGKKCITCKGTF
jgi:hypothetical protein